MGARTFSPGLNHFTAGIIQNTGVSLLPARISYKGQHVGVLLEVPLFGNSMILAKHFRFSSIE